MANLVSLQPFDIALSTITTVTDFLLCGALVTLLSMSRTGSVGCVSHHEVLSSTLVWFPNIWKPERIA